MIKILFLSFFLLTSFLTKANEKNEYTKINYQNYQEILKNKQNDIYLNPFEEDKILILLFNKNNNNFLDNLNEKYDSILSYAFFYTTVDGIFVAHIEDSKKNTHFNVFNFLLDSEIGTFLSNIMKNEKVGKYYPEIIFLHEIFHLNHQSNKNYKKDEVKADLFASLIISKKYNLDKEKSKELFSNFFYIRYNFLDDNFKENKHIEKYYNKIKEKAYSNYNEIIKVDSLESINKKIINL